MTESEIMKALECCAEQKPCKECPLCNYAQDADKCKNKVFVNALDLLNRKNAENEELKRNYGALKYQENLSRERKMRGNEK